MAHYFSYVPNFDYVSRLPNAKIGDYIQIKNFFRRGVVFEELFNNLVYFEKYNIEGDERPDTVAKKYYGDPTLDWVIFLSNNYTNVQDEWPISQKVFDKVMIDKYGSYENFYSGIHHYESNEIKDTRGRIIFEAGKTLIPTWKTNGNFIETLNTKIEYIYYDEEVNLVFVKLENELSFLKEGLEFTIEITNQDYNGTFIIETVPTELLNFFSYKLPTKPVEIIPTLSTPRKEEVRFLLTDELSSTGNAYYFEYYDGDLGYTVSIPSNEFLREVTNYEYEIEIENRKREIFLLKPQYLNILFDDLETIMTYRSGSSQFVNRKLKKGQNINLYKR